MRLKDKAAVVTCGSSGLGKACAERFLKEGARVLVADHCKGQSFSLNVKMEENAAYCTADLTVPAEAEKVMKAAAELFGRIDILVSNFSMGGEKGRIDELPDSDWYGVIENNLSTQFLCSKYAVAEMAGKNGGSLIFVSGASGIRVAPENAAFNATRMGVLGLMRCIATEQGAQNIRANAVCSDYSYAEDRREREPEVMPNFLGKAASDEEITDSIVFLASDESRHITGSTLVVDGGLQII